MSSAAFTYLVLVHFCLMIDSAWRLIERLLQSVGTQSLRAGSRLS